MNPGSPSRHLSEAEEEDSPLQQSAQGAHPSIADSYPEDIMSEAEEEMAGLTTEEAADKEVDGGAEEEEQDDGALENEGTVPPQAESHWRTDFKALVTAPNSTEIVMLKSHMERGLSMP
jgi:hypothetical protein